MIKKVTYKGKQYEIEILWGGNCYCCRAIGVGGFVTIPNDCINVVEKAKPYIEQAINKVPELKEIQDWDGNL